MAILSIALDPAEQQVAVKQQYGIDAPMLVDAEAEVSSMYDVMQWAAGTGEPGHTFALVNEDGELVWLRDYGAAENGGSMYVPVDEMVQQVKASLES